VPGGVLGGIPGGSLGGLANAFPPPPPPAAKVTKPVEAGPAHAAPASLSVGGDVQAALLIHQVTPAYPAIAKDARIQGTVRLSAIIAPDGTVKDLKVISGSPLLTDSAVNAVKKWVYRPTYLNGVPVEVITEIIVKFNLQRPIG
jgi:protein TonB